MKEIEIKAKLKDKEKVMAKLKELGCVFEAPITQEDIIFSRNVGTLEEFIADGLTLRIRVKNGKKIFFTLKKREGNYLEATEHEVEISSREEMEKALLVMGYKEVVRVNKTRIITYYKGDEICLDEVENLGSFMEMERLTKEGDAKKIQEELFKFFESLGISRADRVLLSYDILVMQKK